MLWNGDPKEEFSVLPKCILESFIREDIVVKGEWVTVIMIHELSGYQTDAIDCQFLVSDAINSSN